MDSYLNSTPSRLRLPSPVQYHHRLLPQLHYSTVNNHSLHHLLLQLHRQQPQSPSSSSATPPSTTRVCNFLFFSMNMNSYPHDPFTHNHSYRSDCIRACVFFSTRGIRAYSFFPVQANDVDPDMLAQSLGCYDPLPYPYTWYVYRNIAAIVNIIDLHHYETRQQASSSTTINQPRQVETMSQNHSQIIDEVSILEDVNMDEVMNRSFEEATADCVGFGGLTKKDISNNLSLMDYHSCGEEAADICVVCQVQFESKETVGVLQCKHQYHPKCIKKWLLRKNVCPLCMTQALTV